MLFKTAYNRYYVNVMAVRGGEKSEPTKSDTFSYNVYATANIKCMFSLCFYWKYHPS